MAETRQSVHTTVTIGRVFKVHFTVLRISANRQLYDSEFQIEGALTVNTFADNASVILGAKNNNLPDDRNVRAGW